MGDFILGLNHEMHEAMSNQCVLFMCRLLAVAVALAVGILHCDVGLAQRPWNQKQRPVVMENDYVRSGFPWEVRRFARPTRTPAYDYGYVGGGAAINWGRPRSLEQGTWGRDYVGVLYPRAVWLNYWGPSRYQGGTGGYTTDGPRLFGE